MTNEEQKAIEALREWGSLMRQADAAVKNAWNRQRRPDDTGDSPEYRIALALREAEQAQALIVERLARQLGSRSAGDSPQ